MTKQEEQVRAQLRAHAERRAAHTRAGAAHKKEGQQLQSELARLAPRAAKILGKGRKGAGAPTAQIAKLAGVSRDTVSRAIGTRS